MQPQGQLQECKQTCKKAVARGKEQGHAKIIEIVDVSAVVADHKADQDYGRFNVHLVRESGAEVVRLQKCMNFLFQVLQRPEHPKE